MMSTPHNPVNDSKTSGRHNTFWLTTEWTGSFAPLKENLNTDVVIVGGGLAGVTTAYCLCKAGKKVVLVEDGKIASGETGRTTAHLVSALDDRYFDLESIFGQEDTKLVAESHIAAIKFVESTVREENIDCDFERVDGYLFLHLSDKIESLREEFEASKRAGVSVSETSIIPGMKNYMGLSLKFPGQAQFHPVKYLQGLCDAIVRMGGRIFTDTHAEEINHEGIKSRDGFSVKADHIVVATNSPVNNSVAMHLKQTAHRTYVIAGLVKKGSLPRALWWDTGDHEADSKHPPYHYIRVHPYDETHDLLISGGEDHATGDIPKDEQQEENRYKKLEAWTRDHFPLENILYCWSGQVLEPVDCLGFIGRNPLDKDNVYIITGDSGTGMTHCTIGGILLTDLITGKENPWEEIYNPSRITAKTGDVFFKDLMRAVLSLVKGVPKSEKAKELSEIQNGDGRVIKLSGHKCGVYRDDSGELHIVSAKCTHLKATLTWNGDEKTWDCPWHGSRFTCDGNVINGPANFNLDVYRETEDEGVAEKEREKVSK